MQKMSSLNFFFPRRIVWTLKNMYILNVIANIQTSEYGKDCNFRRNEATKGAFWVFHHYNGYLFHLNANCLDWLPTTSETSNSLLLQKLESAFKSN